MEVHTDVLRATRDGGNEPWTPLTARFDRGHFSINLCPAPPAGAYGRVPDVRPSRCSEALAGLVGADAIANESGGGQSQNGHGCEVVDYKAHSLVAIVLFGPW